MGSLRHFSKRARTPHPHVKKIFLGQLGQILEDWGMATVFFFRKVGKKDFSIAKSIRAVCLVSFPLKAMERIVGQVFVGRQPRKEPYSPAPTRIQIGKVNGNGPQRSSSKGGEGTIVFCHVEGAFNRLGQTSLRHLDYPGGPFQHSGS